MLKKYISKFTIDILPSVAATVIGAYIVNHYIVHQAGHGRPCRRRRIGCRPQSLAKKNSQGR